MMVRIEAYTMLDKLEVHVSVLDWASGSQDLVWSHWRGGTFSVPREVADGPSADFVALVGESILDLAYGR